MNYYDPQAPPQQEPHISLGPYNADQAPHLDCESCGSPITVGQELVELKRWRLAIVLPSGQLCFWPTEESKMTMLPDGQQQQQPIYVHADCSAEYAHDHITKEPCGNEDGYEGC